MTEVFDFSHPEAAKKTIAIEAMKGLLDSGKIGISNFESMLSKEQKDVFCKYFLLGLSGKEDISYTQLTIGESLISGAALDSEDLCNIVEIICRKDIFESYPLNENLFIKRFNEYIQEQKISQESSNRIIKILTDSTSLGAANSNIFEVFLGVSPLLAIIDSNEKDAFLSAARELDTKTSANLGRYSYKLLDYLKEDVKEIFPSTYSKANDLIQTISERDIDFTSNLVKRLDEIHKNPIVVNLVKAGVSKYSVAKEFLLMADQYSNLRNDPLFTELFSIASDTVTRAERSNVTAEYFKDWNDLVIEGNPELKDKIRRNITRIENKNLSTYASLAERLGLTVDTLKSELQKKVEDLVSKSFFFRATKIDVLDKVLNKDGRYKSQFETGTSNGCLDVRYRAHMELVLFGFNQGDSPDTEFSRDRRETYETVYDNKHLRPIYGYFSDDKNGIINKEGKVPPPCRVHSYGTVNVKIKKAVALRKSTIAFSDTLGDSTKAAVPASKPHFVGLNIDEYYGDSNILADLKRSSTTTWGSSYTEVQYHGQLTVDDIESIHISRDNDMSDEEMDEVREIFRRFKESHPESDIQLIEYSGQNHLNKILKLLKLA